MSVVTAPLAAPSLSLNGVGKRFLGRNGTVEAIGEVSFSVASGEFVAVVGPSGCGKSTLLRMLAGLDVPTQGSVSVDGTPAVSVASPPGVAFQRPVLLPWRTALENVALPSQVGPGARGSRSVLRDRARQLLEEVGLDGFENAYPHELSGGMQQRVALCRSLLSNSGLSLLDEPFAALDALTREDLMFVLHDLWREHRTTTVFVTHGIAEAVFLASRVVVLSGRPSSVATVVEVDLPEHREPALLHDPAFVALTTSVRDALHRPG
ncbi:ABC transporter ATP-binding protein [Nocardioides humi]|uniref:ABC transporter ATP-binding protein n=1 Tax=Nocardioides humi TaxID=449461 RepID=A0ABN2A1H2_9ACTN|nr:ABC transporter ATP-binding protein [Nocardioides humi]